MATYGKELNACMKVIATMRGDDEQMQMQTAQVFLAIALQPGITSQQIAERVGLSQSSVSRNTASLGEWHRFGKPGLNWIEAEADPRERRRRIHFLTPKGKKKAMEVIEAMTGEPVTDLHAPTFKDYMKGGAGVR